MHRARQGGEGTEPPCSLQAPASQDLHLFISLEALRVPSFWGFMEASYRGVTESVALAIDSNCSSSALLGAGEIENSNSPNTGLFPLATSRFLDYLRVFLKVTSFTLKKKKRQLFPLSSEEIPRVFRRSVARNGVKEQRYISYCKSKYHRPLQKWNSLFITPLLKPRSLFFDFSKFSAAQSQFMSTSLHRSFPGQGLFFHSWEQR